jgi:hypothetical protein
VGHHVAVDQRSGQPLNGRARPGRRGAALAVAPVVLGAGVTAVLALRRLGRRSGVSNADIARPLPGDELVAAPALVVDRAAMLPAPAAEVWPWLVQLGKERAWWYLPASVERFVSNRDKRGARRILPELQGLAVGDRVPDWGPGTPLFEVATLDPPHALVYLSVRQRSRGWTWPEPTEPVPADALALSWALVLDDFGEGRSRLHIRLRAASREGSISPWLSVLGGLVDYVTIVVLFAGLRERLIGRDGGSLEPSPSVAGA